MKRTWTISAAIAATLCASLAAGGSNTPIVPNRIGHWMNLEYRTGNLAPEIASNPRLIESILVVEGSLEKVDASLLEVKTGGNCLQLGLPFIRVKHETVHGHDSSGNTVATMRKVRKREVLTVRVCSGVTQRSVIWELNGDLIILTRPRLETGVFSRTLYMIHHITGEERLRAIERNARLAARNREPVPPQAKMLYSPMVFGDTTRISEPRLFAFGAEFSSPPPVTVNAHDQNCTGCQKGVHSSQIEH